jgi:NAD-dependent SIR2 family protein deacetylase
MVFPNTLYEEIAQELCLDPNAGPVFPALMSAYCKRPDGRQRLLQKIKHRFDYMKAFPELYWEATRFHRELATLFHIQDIITTNWDDFFEKECGATPYVSPDDFALWGVPGRKVFKIHGSINNLGSIVATTEDYEACYRNLSEGVIGGTLKSMLATKTIVYVGYSFSDSDFLKIHSILSKEMKGLRPHAYLVTLDRSACERCEDVNITPIITDGAYFISQLKAHIIADGQMLPDQNFSDIPSILFAVLDIHESIYETDLSKYPTAIYTLAYQDGLQHAFQRILAMRNTGQYSHECYVRGQISTYERFRRQSVKEHNYWDAAYIEGYQNGLMCFILTRRQVRRSLPIFYVFGLKDHPRTVKEYKRCLRHGATIHKAAYGQAKKIVQRKTLGVPGVGLHHTPFL